jgi:hypothetical protein
MDYEISPFHSVVLQCTSSLAYLAAGVNTSPPKQHAQLHTQLQCTVHVFVQWEKDQ